MNKLFRIACYVLLLKIALGITLLLYIDDLLRTGLENLENKELGISVSVDKLYVSLFTGAVNIHGFKIGNPSGFSNQRAFIADHVHMKFDIFSFFKKAAVINTLNIKSATFYLEINEQNSSNLDALKAYFSHKHIPSHVSKDNTSFMDYINGNALQRKEIIINKLIVSDLALRVGDKLQPVNLLSTQNGDIKNIGLEENGVSIQVATERIIHHLLKVSTSMQP